MGNFKELLAYKKAFALAMKIFNLSKSFPSEELYSLTGQIRRSSRSVCANIAEAYRRRRFENYYISKLKTLKQKIPKLMFGWICNVLPLYIQTTT